MNYNSEKMKSQSNWVYLEKSVFNDVSYRNYSLSLYNPFDNITGQTISEFHEEQKVLVCEVEDGDGKKKK
ncbi:hypothetical protein FUT12_19395 [Bacillus mycoides]|nr:hypothetical protein [Bacillus mycoides]